MFGTSLKCSKEELLTGGIGLIQSGNFALIYVLGAITLSACATPKEKSEIGSNEARQEEGSLTAKEIEDVIRAGFPAIKDCINVDLDLPPGNERRCVSKFVINPDGTVGSSSTHFKDALNGEGMEKCIDKVIVSWTFPKPRGGGIVKVKYPFVFSRK